VKTNKRQFRKLETDILVKNPSQLTSHAFEKGEEFLPRQQPLALCNFVHHITFGVYGYTGTRCMSARRPYGDNPELFK
jgi:hypothetical protein